MMANFPNANEAKGNSILVYFSFDPLGSVNIYDQ